MKRPLALLTLAFAPFLSVAQVANEATLAVQDAFRGLASNSTLRLRVAGTESFGRSTIPVTGELYWSLKYDASGRATAQVEYTEYRDGYLVQRSVGDGTTFYSYEPLKNEYWVATYGSHGANVPTRYLSNLVDDLTASTKGSATYLARLLREAYVVSGFRAWIPGAQENLLTKDEAPFRDPVVPGRTYAGSDTLQYGLFWFGNPVRKTLAFELALSGSGSDLRAIYFAEASTLSGTPRVVEWRADVEAGIAVPAGRFVFVPPARARIIVGPRPNIG